MGLITTPQEQFEGSNFEEYQHNFPYQGEDLFKLLYKRNPDKIKYKKIGVATTNLQKIFDATFKLSAKIGFHEMSLRDLSNETNISMGGLYSCLTKKEDIAFMVLDIVELITSQNNERTLQEADELVSLELGIKHHLYASTLLQPWFFFLYFETKCLSPENQIRSKNIELNIIQTFETQIQKGLDKQLFDVVSPYFVAQTILIVMQDWYLKPWKQKQKQIDLETYSHYLFIMAKKLLRLNDKTACG